MHRARGTMLLVWSLAAMGCRSSLTDRGTKGSLKVEYGERGLTRLSYGGYVIDDLTQHPEDAFHIWHMKTTDLKGTPLTTGQYGWGENYTSREWDSRSHTWIYTFTWGTIATQFVQRGATLDLEVTEHNNAGSGVIQDGAAIYPFALHLPRGVAPSADAFHLASNTTEPSVSTMVFGKGSVNIVVPDPGRSLYTGFVPGGKDAVLPLVSGTAPDGLPAFAAHLDRPITPGETDRYTVSLRFAAAGADPAEVARDAYKNWADRWPARLQWTDRRIVGAIYLASSPNAAAGDATRPGGFANNPRRYFSDADATDFDVRRAEGLIRFQNRVLAQARASVEILQRLHAQGAITWDLEGEEYPQTTSYVCAPDQIAAIAPEMESVLPLEVRYGGMKLDDAYFKVMRDAGFRVGVCVRPQRFMRGAAGSAQQVFLKDEDVAAELIRKMRYAHDRWGATLFYLDSTVDRSGAALDPSIIKAAATALPDSLLIPEEIPPAGYAFAAPFLSFIFHGDIGTPAAVRRYYPRAFSVNLVNDADGTKVNAAKESLTDAVRGGDILMGHADYWHPNDALLVQIYQDAGRQ